MLACNMYRPADLLHFISNTTYAQWILLRFQQSILNIYTQVTQQNNVLFLT